MDVFFETIVEVAKPVAEILKEWGEDAIDNIKEQALHNLRYVGYALI